jgi:manganese transport system ATP-binding protein
MRKVLVHGDPLEVLRPENLALAFGLDVREGPLAGTPREGVR